tara:strand:- start:308 stop:1015 length:708 start_codon:yes stop_codon:yes gene_type:complete
MKFFSLLLGVLIPVIASSQHAVPDFTHVPYGPDANNWLNIYLADGEAKKPVLVFSHANGSTADQFPLKVWNDLKKAGVSAISWESVPQLKNLSEYQTCQEDFRSVLDWVENNSEKYGFDLENIIICGRSRGSIVTWSALHTYPEKFRGAYMTQALPKGGWNIRDFTKDVTPESPALFLAYAENLDTSDGHTPLNGLKIKKAYEFNGITDQFRFEHSLGKPDLYKHLMGFIQKIVE